MTKRKRERGICDHHGCGMKGLIYVIPAQCTSGYYLCRDHWNDRSNTGTSFADIVAAKRNAFTYEVVGDHHE